MVLNFESVVSNWEKLVNDNWLNGQRHLPSVGVNVTSEFPMGKDTFLAPLIMKIYHITKTVGIGEVGLACPQLISKCSSGPGSPLHVAAIITPWLSSSVSFSKVDHVFQSMHTGWPCVMFWAGKFKFCCMLRIIHQCFFNQVPFTNIFQTIFFCNEVIPRFLFIQIKVEFST